VYEQRVSLIVFFVVVAWSGPTLADGPELKLGQARESSLSPGQAQSFVVPLSDGDFAQIAVNPRGQALVVKTYDPSGKPFRGAELGPREDKLNFVAEVPGAYRVEVAAVDKRTPAPVSGIRRRLEMSSRNPARSIGFLRQAAIPQISARSPTGSRASSSPAPRSRSAFTWTPGAQSSARPEGLTPYCFALARCATCCAPRATRCAFRSSSADTTTSAGVAHSPMV